MTHATVVTAGAKTDEHRDRAALGLEHRLRHVAEVLPVRLQGHRPVADDLDPVLVVQVEDAAAHPPRQERERHAREGHGADPERRDDVEPELELRLRGDRDRDAARVRVRRPVRDERAGGAAVALHLEHGLELEPVRRQRAHDCEREREVARAAAVLAATELVDAADRLRVDADPGGEGEAASVDAAHRDAAAAPGEQRVRDVRSRGDRIGRDTERTREHARPTAGDEADRHAVADPVQDLVEAAVAGVDDDRVAVGLARELGGVARPGRTLDADLTCAPELARDRVQPLRRDVRGERIDDERDAHPSILYRMNRLPAVTKPPRAPPWFHEIRKKSRPGTTLCTPIAVNATRRPSTRPTPRSFTALSPNNVWVTFVLAKSPNRTRSGVSAKRTPAAIPAPLARRTIVYCAPSTPPGTVSG
jgi:hypothetical protein